MAGPPGIHGTGARADAAGFLLPTSRDSPLSEGGNGEGSQAQTAPATRCRSVRPIGGRIHRQRPRRRELYGGRVRLLDLGVPPDI